MCQKLLQVAAKSASCHALVTGSPHPPHPGEAWGLDKMEKINIYSNPLLKVLLNLPTKSLKFIAFGFFQMECC